MINISINFIIISYICLNEIFQAQRIIFFFLSFNRMILRD